MAMLPRILAIPSPTSSANPIAAPIPIATQAQTVIFSLYRHRRGILEAESVRVLLDYPKGVGAWPQALRTAVIPLDENLDLIRVEDRAAKSNACLRTN